MILYNDNLNLQRELLLLLLSVNPYGSGGYYGCYKMMQKTEKWMKSWHMGTHLRVLNKCYPRTTNMTVSVKMVFKNLFINLYATSG